MSSTALEVTFEGPAAKEGTIDAHLLAESLDGYSQVFRRANYLVNGEASEAAVLVRSDFKPGSFIAGLELVQHLVTDLITSHQFLDANELAIIIGFLWQHKDAVKESLIELFKLMKGKKPDKAIQVGNEFELTFGQNKKKVTKVVYHLYGDEVIRAALGKMTGPLREAAIDRIAMRKDGKEQATITKSEAEYFESEPLQLEADGSPMEGERDSVLIVSKLSFVEGSSWTFIEKGATVVAKIEDDDFWRNVHHHKISFGEGDRLRVRLRWRVVQSKARKLLPKNIIVKVHEVLTFPKQELLKGMSSEETFRPKRRIRLED